jgi:hypothetical protein
VAEQTDPIEEAIRLIEYELGRVECAGLARQTGGFRLSLKPHGEWQPLGQMLRELRRMTSSHG